MEHQNQILQTLRGPESQARLERIVAQEALNNRAAVGRRVCAEFGFVDARGSAQLAGCLKALNTLHKAGRIALPASRGGGGAPTPQRFDAPVAAATAVPGTVEAVAGLSLERVEQGRQRRVWNTLLHFEHPQGTTTFAGCQVRYLVVSAHGVLGAVGFSASALHLRAREAWMGWSAEQRQAHLHRVLCLSRFLIRPGVQCRNLASQVLGQVLARLPADFEARYRYRPWLVETFVGPAHDGASFKAANFVWVGHTAGRGRQDRDHARARPVKSVYMYELEPHWRRRLGVARVDAAPALAPADGLDSAAWTVNEFGGAPLGDQRLSARLVKSAGLLASLPGEAVTANASHDRAAVKGYYRLIDQPVSSAVTPGNILAPHRARTLQRMRGEDTVLCIQDGTDLKGSSASTCACSDSSYAPARHANAARVPTSTSAVRRTWGKAARPRDAPGAPNACRFVASSGTFSVDPSNATRRRPRYHDPRVARSATGPTRAARNASNGADPKRVLAREIDDFPDTRSVASDDTHRSPSIRQRSTSRADTDRNSPNATT